MSSMQSISISINDKIYIMRKTLAQILFCHFFFQGKIKAVKKYKTDR